MRGEQECTPWLSHELGGSSKAMAGDAAVELLNGTKSSEYQISTIINDEDSTTMARIAS